MNDLIVYYLGGNQTVKILAHDPNYANNVTFNITYYYSDWDYSYPQYIDFFEFIPRSSQAKNVTPYGQTSSRPMMNVTALNFDSLPFNYSIHLNETYTCVNLTVSTTKSKGDGSLLINGSWTGLIANQNYTDTFGLWYWADYACNYTEWRVWQPDMQFRGCCNYCDVCDTGLI